MPRVFVGTSSRSWILDAEGPRDGALRGRSLRGAVLTWRAVPAGAAEGSPRTVHRLARL